MLAAFAHPAHYTLLMVKTKLKRNFSFLLSDVDLLKFSSLTTSAVFLGSQSLTSNTDCQTNIKPLLHLQCRQLEEDGRHVCRQTSPPGPSALKL